MPRINTNTTSGINFAIEHKDSYISYTNESGYTGYQFQKQEFDYHEATISLENFDENYKLEDLSAQVKIRGNSIASIIKNH